MAFKKAAKGFGVGLVAAAASLAVYYNMDQEDRARVINKLDNLQSKAETKADIAEDRLKAAGHDVKSAAHTAKADARQAWSETKSETSDIKHDIEDKTQEALEKGKEVLHQADGIAHDLAQTAKETTSQLIHDVDDKLHELKDNTKTLIHDYATQEVKPPPSVTGPVDKAPVRDHTTITKKDSAPMPPPQRVPNPSPVVGQPFIIGDSFTPVAALVAMNVSIAAFLGLAK